MSGPEKIVAEDRTEFGKGAARRIRRDHKVPAVVYEHGDTPQHITLPGHQTMMALRKGGHNALLELEIGGKSQLALTKHVQVDPIRREIEHIDFIAVKRGEKVVVEVPIHVVGEPGFDTLVMTETATVQVEAEALHIPESFEVSVEGAPAGTLIHAKDLTLPNGVTLVDDGEVLLVNVAAQVSEAALEAELAEAEADAGIEHEAPAEETAEAPAEDAAE